MVQSRCRECFDCAHELGGHAELEAVVRKCADEYSTEELKSMIPGRTRLPYPGARGGFVPCEADTHLSVARCSGGVHGSIRALPGHLMTVRLTTLLYLNFPSFRASTLPNVRYKEHKGEYLVNRSANEPTVGE